MKEVTIDGVVYIPKIQEKKLVTSVGNILRALWPKPIMKHEAYSDVLRISKYLNNEFKSDGCTWVIEYRLDGVYVNYGDTLPAIYHFTSKEAAEYALLHFKQVFKTFYS